MSDFARTSKRVAASLSLMMGTIAIAMIGVAAAQTSAAPDSVPTPRTNSSVYAELAKAPEKAVSRRNPLEVDPEAVPAGAKLFARHCAECHGETADGGRKAPSLRVPEVQQATPGALFWLLTNGVVRRGMPVWSRLPEPQRWQLVSYIKSLDTRSASQRDGETATH